MEVPNEGQLGTYSRQRPKNIDQEKSDSIPSSLIGQANECSVSVDGVTTKALLDTGSMISSISESFWRNNLNSELHPLSELLTIHGAGGHNLPYLGYIETALEIQNIDHTNKIYPFLIVPDTTYSKLTPILVGTNILRPIRENLLE